MDNSEFNKEEKQAYNPADYSVYYTVAKNSEQVSEEPPRAVEEPINNDEVVVENNYVEPEVAPEPSEPEQPVVEVSESEPVVSEEVKTEEPEVKEESKPIAPEPASKPRKTVWKNYTLSQIIITSILGIIVVYAATYIILFDFVMPKRDIGPATSASGLTIDEQFSLGANLPVLSDTFKYQGAYSNKLITMEEIDPEVLLNVAYNEIVKTPDYLIQSDEAEYTAFKKKYCPTEATTCFEIYNSTFESILNRRFGTGKHTYVDFQIGNDSNSVCTVLPNSDYMCHVATTPIESTNIKASNIVLSKSDTDNIYLYEKVLFLDGYKMTTTSKGYQFNIGTIYKYMDKSIEIDKDVVLESASDVVSLDLIPKYEQQLQLYKHTFKKNDSGNWLWFSTEPVESTEY